MKEKNLYPLFRDKNETVGVFEIKLVKKNCIPFKNIYDHQIEALQKADSDCGLYHKIADQTVGRNNTFGWTLKKPFDCFYVKNIPAYVVIIFYIPIKKKIAYYIRIKDFVKMKSEAIRKSITEEMAKNYAEKVLDLKGKIAID